MTRWRPKWTRPGRPTGQSKTRPTLQAGLTPCASVAWLGRAGQPHAGHALFQAPTNGSKHRHQNTHRVLSATLYERTRVGKGSAATGGHNPFSTSARARRWGGGGNLPGAGSVDGMKGSRLATAGRQPKGHQRCVGVPWEAAALRFYAERRNGRQARLCMSSLFGCARYRAPPGSLASCPACRYRSYVALETTA